MRDEAGKILRNDATGTPVASALVASTDPRHPNYKPPTPPPKKQPIPLDESLFGEYALAVETKDYESAREWVAWQAATEAGRRTDKDKETREFGGSICAKYCKNTINGKCPIMVRNTGPVHGIFNSFSELLSPCPDGWFSVGSYHSHPRTGDSDFGGSPSGWHPEKRHTKDWFRFGVLWTEDVPRKQAELAGAASPHQFTMSDDPEYVSTGHPDKERGVFRIPHHPPATMPHQKESPPKPASVECTF